MIVIIIIIIQYGADGKDPQPTERETRSQTSRSVADKRRISAGSLQELQ